MSQPFYLDRSTLPEDMKYEMKEDTKQDLISVRLNNDEHRRVLIVSNPVTRDINLTEIKTRRQYLQLFRVLVE